MKLKRMWRILFSVIALLIVSGQVGSQTVVYASDGDRQKIVEHFFNDDKDACAIQEPDKAAETSGESDSGATSGVSGSWKDKNSKAYKNAKDTWDDWKTHGASGESIAGILGCIVNEGGFEMADRPEGYYGTDPKMGLAVGGFDPQGGGGGGPYQFSPYTKYAPKGDSKWLDMRKQTEFVWNSEVKNGVQSLSMGRISAEKMLSATDIAQGAFMWANGYERGQGMSSIDTPSMRERIAAAKEVYKLFDGQNVKANSSLINGAGDGTDAPTEGTKYADETNACPTVSEVLADAEDGTGTHSQAIGSVWQTYEELPDDVKKYAHNPADLLGPRGSGSKWKEMGVSGTSENQCVGFSVAYGNMLWGLKGNRSGNGVDTAKSFADDLGMKTTNTPHAGAIFSQSMPRVPEGHTGVIMHVYANGDMLVTEQNFKGKSGAGNGETFTWDFRIVGKKDFESKDSYYAYPKEAKKTLKWR